MTDDRVTYPLNLRQLTEDLLRQLMMNMPPSPVGISPSVDGKNEVRELCKISIFANKKPNRFPKPIRFRCSALPNQQTGMSVLLTAKAAPVRSSSPLGEVPRGWGHSCK